MKKRKLATTRIDEQIIELVNKSDHKILVIWATDCAERVLPYFEKNFPEDKRPREAIEAGRAWVRSELKMTEARKIAFAGHAAARNASENITACSSARSAGHAAATAHVPSHSIYAAVYAISAICDSSEPTEIEMNINKERDWQYQRLIELRNKSSPLS